MKYNDLYGKSAIVEVIAVGSRVFSDNQRLNRFRFDVQSQFGEDGIIEEIFRTLPASEQNHWCCEFGAWDGLHCSNTYNLIANRGWQGVLIEANPKKFIDLQKTYRGAPQTILLNEFVDVSGNDLDAILQRSGAPNDLDFLSIDIDSIDYQIWDSLKRFRPKVVLIEFNPTIPDNIEFIQSDDAGKKQGTSLLSMTKLASSKGYELIWVNAENAFYVDGRYFHLFGITDNSIAALKYYREPLQVFQLFDGTLVFHGNAPHSLIWYSLPVDFNRLQVLPEFVRNINAPWGGGILGALVRAPIKLLRNYRRRAWKGQEDNGSWKM